MTANLPRVANACWLRNAGCRVFPETLEGLDDLRTKAEHPRYNLRTMSQEEAEKIAEQALAGGQKSLVGSQSSKEDAKALLSL